MVGCSGSNGLWDSLSVYIGPSPREGERREMIDGRKNIQTTYHTHHKRSRPLPPPLSKPARRPSTGSLPSTIAPPLKDATIRSRV